MLNDIFPPIRSLVTGLIYGAASLVSAHTALEQYSAPIQSVTASSTAEPALTSAQNAADWNWISRWESDGEREGAWIEYTFSRPVRVGVIMLVDQANKKGAAEEVTFTFSDGKPLTYRLPSSPAYIPEQNGYLSNPIDTDPHKKTDMGAHHLRLSEPRMTTRIRATITGMAEGTTPAGLAELRILEVPQDDIQPEAPPERVQAAACVGYGLTTNAPAVAFTYNTPSYTLTISKDTGLPERMTDLKPTPVDFIGGAEGKPFTLYMQNLDRGWNDRFTRLLSWYEQSGVEEGEGFRELTCMVAPETHQVAVACLRYRMFKDRVETSIRFDYLVEDWCRYRFGLYNHLNPQNWPLHRDTGGPISTYLSNSQAPAYQRSYTHAYDICWEEGGWSNEVFPFGYYQRDDRYMAYGSFDLAKHVIFGPHTPVENAHPSLFFMPLGLRNGDSYTLDLFFKSFDRSNQGYMEMLRWYARRTHLWDPDFKGVPVRLPDAIPRTLPVGVFVGGVEHHPADSDEIYKAIMDQAVHDEMFNAMYGFWDVWVHPPEKFEHASWSGYLGKLSSEKFRKNIAMLRSRGIQPYVYMNNFVSPPWLSTPAIKGRLINPDDDNERDWYVARAKSMVNEWLPGGIFWDCGWWPLHYASPNNQIVSNPRSDTSRGWLKVQAEMFTWIQQAHPDMHVAGNNMAGGTPSQFFYHATTIESGLSPSIIEESKAFGTAVINLHTPAVEFEKYGITQAEAEEHGISAVVAGEVWTNFVAKVRHSLAYGATQVGLIQNKRVSSPERRKAFPYGIRNQYIPETLQIQELEHFCALANGTPALPETFVIRTGNPSVIGSVWANRERLLVCMYNNSDDVVQVDSVIDRSVLAKYNSTRIPSLDLIRLGPDWIAIGKPNLIVHTSNESLKLTGSIGARETILILGGEGSEVKR